MKLWDFKVDVAPKFIDYHYASINDPAYTMTQVYKHRERTPTIEKQSNSVPLEYKIQEENEFEKILLNRHSWSMPFLNNQHINLDLIAKFSQLAFIGNSKRNRNYPSGGAQYLVNIHYLFNNNRVDQDVIQAGTICRLNMDNHTLIGERFVDWDIIRKAFIAQAGAATAQFAIVLSVDLMKISEKYTDISYKLVQQEAGHIGQNIQLVAEYLNIKSLPLGGFYDNAMNKLIGNSKTTLYTLLLG